MAKTLTFLMIPFFAVLLSGCAGAASPATSDRPASCPPDYEWDGKECKDKRTIILEQGRPAPTSSSPTPSAAPAPPSPQ